MFNPIKINIPSDTTSIFDVPAAKIKKRVIIQYKDNNGKNYELLKVDVTNKEDYTFNSEVTKHPIANGSYVSDHIIKTDDSIVINGTISDDPISIDITPEVAKSGKTGDMYEKPWENMTGSTPEEVHKTTTKLMEDINNTSNRSLAAFEALKSIRTNETVCDIVTGLTTMTNMVMTSLSISRDSSTTRCLNFVTKFTKIKFAYSAKETIPAWVITADQDATVKIEEGKQAPKAPTEGEFRKGQSGLMHIVETAAGLTERLLSGTN